MGMGNTVRRAVRFGSNAESARRKRSRYTRNDDGASIARTSCCGEWCRRDESNGLRVGQKNRIVYVFCCGADYILNVVPARAATYNPRTQSLRRSLDTEPHRKIPRFGSRPSPGRPRASGVVLQLICPTSGRAKLLSTPCRKNICLFRNSDLPYSRFRSAPREGRLAIAADVVRNVVDGSVS